MKALFAQSNPMRTPTEFLRVLACLVFAWSSGGAECEAARAELPETVTARPASAERSSAKNHDARVVSEQKLEAFATAFIKVRRIFDFYDQKIGEADDIVRARALQQEANQEMNRAVQAEGLTVEEYNRIFQATLKDAELREKANALIREKEPR